MKGFFHAGNTAGYTYEEIFFASIIRQAQTIRQVIPKRTVPTGNLSKTDIRCFGRNAKNVLHSESECAYSVIYTAGYTGQEHTCYTYYQTELNRAVRLEIRHRSLALVDEHGLDHEKVIVQGYDGIHQSYQH